VNQFKTISPLEIKDNPIQLIGKEWMLITAGTQKRFNTMTASWGGIGELWFKPVCFIFVRPQRYTYEFIEQEEGFTLSFFEERYKPQFNICGSHSGRDINKVLDCGLSPVKAENGSVYFEEARMVLECRKLYFHDLDATHFMDPSLLKHYPEDDFHRMYVGEITRALITNN